uniref:Uncharacterized protein n=1 Tax=Oryza meridionalis TaxID=40149 RepID=A0A0E0D8Y7_9ORYZ
MDAHTCSFSNWVGSGFAAIIAALPPQLQSKKPKEPIPQIEGKRTASRKEKSGEAYPEGEGRRSRDAAAGIEMPRRATRLQKRGRPDEPFPQF